MSRFDNYLFRCSALGKIVTASGKLTDAAKTYLGELFIGEIYGVRKEAYGKALEKGIFCEQDGLEMIQNTLLKGQLVLKNKERKSNDYIHGECDLFKNSIIYDVKNAYTLFSFGKAELTHEYLWQLKGYSWLWNANKAVLYYSLNNLPEHMLEDEKRSLLWKNRWLYLTEESPNYIEACKELEAAHNYDKMPLEEKFKFWEVSPTKDDYEKITTCVIQSRVYLNSLWVTHMESISRNKKAMGLESSVILAHHDHECGATIVEPENILLKLKKITK